jgi:hypothetical protein
MSSSSNPRTVDFDASLMPFVLDVPFGRSVQEFNWRHPDPRVGSGVRRERGASGSQSPDGSCRRPLWGVFESGGRDSTREPDLDKLIGPVWSSPFRLTQCSSVFGMSI